MMMHAYVKRKISCTLKKFIIRLSIFVHIYSSFKDKTIVFWGMKFHTIDLMEANKRLSMKNLIFKKESSNTSHFENDITNIHYIMCSKFVITPN
jgi:hypothetical protein